MILPPCLWIFLFPPTALLTAADLVVPEGATLLERERWTNVRRRRRLAVEVLQQPENVHLHRVDGFDPFSTRGRSGDESWMQQEQSDFAFSGNGTCRPFADVRKSMEELHAKAKETLLELIAALGRMQAQAQLEKTAIDNLVDVRKTTKDSLQTCEQQKAAALSNAEKYSKELKELSQIAQADATVYTRNVSKVSLVQEVLATLPTSLLQRDLKHSEINKQVATTIDVHPSVSLADANGGHSEGAATSNALSQSLYNNVEQAAEELRLCLAQKQSFIQNKQNQRSSVPTSVPTSSPEECASHKERLKKMFAAAYAHITRLKERYEDLADDDSCDKAANEELGSREVPLKDALNATRRHLCSVHKTMTGLTKDAKDLGAKANATHKLLQEMGCTAPECADGKGWGEYHLVILELVALVERHPACTKCCQESGEGSLLQAEQEEEKFMEASDSEADWTQQDLADDDLFKHPRYATSHYWSL